MDERISLRFNGKLLTLRMEDANLENIDRVAKARDQSRSEWMRLAMLTQLAVDLAEIGAPEPEPVDTDCRVHAQYQRSRADLAEEVVFGPAEPAEPEPESEETRPNRWS